MRSLRQSGPLGPDYLHPLVYTNVNWSTKLLTMYTVLPICRACSSRIESFAGSGKHAAAFKGFSPLVVVILCLSLLPGCRSTGGRAALVPPRAGPHMVIARGIPPAPLLAWRPRAAPFQQTRHTPSYVALTFDAGATADAVPLLLQTLEAHHVHATFFLTGKFCERFPRACKAISAAGMEIGNHSYSHPHFTKLSRGAILDQLNRAEAAIIKVCGRGAKPLFRYPYGDYNRRTCQIVAQAGYQSVGWTLDSLDSVGKPKSPQFVAERINRKIRPGYITLMHVSLIRSARALPSIFDHLNKMGVQAVPVSQLLLASTSTSAGSRIATRR